MSRNSVARRFSPQYSRGVPRGDLENYTHKTPEEEIAYDLPSNPNKPRKHNETTPKNHYTAPTNTKNIHVIPTTSKNGNDVPPNNGAEINTPLSEANSSDSV